MTASNLKTLDVVEVMALTGSLPIHSLKSRPIIIGGGGGESKELEACHPVKLHSCPLDQTVSCYFDLVPELMNDNTWKLPHPLQSNIRSAHLDLPSG